MVSIKRFQAERPANTWYDLLLNNGYRVEIDTDSHIATFYHKDYPRLRWNCTVPLPSNNWWIPCHISMLGPPLSTRVECCLIKDLPTYQVRLLATYSDLSLTFYSNQPRDGVPFCVGQEWFLSHNYFDYSEEQRKEFICYIALIDFITFYPTAFWGDVHITPSPHVAINDYLEEAGFQLIYDDRTDSN